MVRGFSLFEKALVVIEAQDWNVQWYTKALALVQMQFCSMVPSCNVYDTNLLQSCRIIDKIPDNFENFALHGAIEKPDASISLSLFFFW